MSSESSPQRATLRWGIIACGAITFGLMALAAFAPAALQQTHVDLARLHQSRAGVAHPPVAPLVAVLPEAPPAEELAAWTAHPNIRSVHPLLSTDVARDVIPESVLDRAAKGGWELPGLPAHAAFAIDTAPGTGREVLAFLRATDPELTLLGLPVVEDALTDSHRGELHRLLALCSVALLAGLALGGRTVRAVVLPLAGVGLSLAATLGIVSLGGWSLGGPNLLVPTVVLVFGLADSVYVLHAWSQTEGDTARRWVATVRDVLGPCALTTATTAGSLLLLAPLTSAPLGEFACLAAMGLALALLGGLAVPLWALAWAPGPTVAPWTVSAPWVEGWIRRLGIAPARLLAITVIIGMLGGALSGRLVPTVRLLDELPSDDPVRMAHETWTDTLDGLAPLEVELSGDEPVGDPRLYRTLLSLHSHLVSQTEVGSVVSFADLALWIARAVNRSPERLAQSEWAGGAGSRGLAKAHEALRSPDGTPWATQGGQAYRLHVRLADWDPLAWSQVVATTQSRRKGFEIRTSGFVDVVVRGMQRIPRDLVVTWSVSFVGLAVGLTLGLRSLRRALLGLVPLVLASGTTAISVWALGLRVTEPVVLAATLALGVGVDAWIHLAVRAARYEAGGASPMEAGLSTLQELGPPIAWTTLLLVLGTACLGTSGLATPGDVATWVVPMLVLDVGATWVLFSTDCTSRTRGTPPAPVG